MLKAWEPTAKQTLADMSGDEFDQLLDQFIERGEDRLTLPTFLQIVSDIADQLKTREVELIGRLVNGEVVFDSPAPLPVETNTLYVGDTKVRLKLRVDREDEGER